MRPFFCNRRAFLSRMSGGLSLAATSAKAGSEAEWMFQECRRRMGMLYEAIRRWQRSHGEGRWPARLTVLRDERLISDARVWVCPVSEKLRDWRGAPTSPTVIFQLAANPESSYSYEFSSENVRPDLIDEPKQWTNVEWKSLLMETPLGGRVPILRCMKHAPAAPGGDPSREGVLNVGADGGFYESGTYWECRFSDIRPEPYGMPYMVRRHPGRPGATPTPRPAGLGTGCLDLDTIANGNPELPWLYGQPGKLTLERFLSETGYGARLTPIAFDARRLVQTTGALVSETLFEADQGFPGQGYPGKSPILPVGGREVKRVHVLHATAFQGKPGQGVGGLEILLRGRPARRFDLVYGVDTGWWRAVPAREGVQAWSFGEGAELTTVYRSVLEMDPGETSAGVEGIRVVADPAHTASPFVLGITLE